MPGTCGNRKKKQRPACKLTGCTHRCDLVRLPAPPPLDIESLEEMAQAVTVGELGRDFAHSVEARASYLVGTRDRYENPARQNMLVSVLIMGAGTDTILQCTHWVKLQCLETFAGLVDKSVVGRWVSRSRLPRLR